jgi:hypothetical protein
MLGTCLPLTLMKSEACAQLNARSQAVISADLFQRLETLAQFQEHSHTVIESSVSLRAPDLSKPISTFIEQTMQFRMVYADIHELELRVSWILREARKMNAEFSTSKPLPVSRRKRVRQLESEHVSAQTRSKKVADRDTVQRPRRSPRLAEKG